MNRKALVPWVFYAGLTVAMLGGAQWPHPRWAVVAAGVAVIAAGIAWKRALEAATGHDAQGEEGARRQGSVAAAVAAMPALVEAVRALVEVSPSGELAAITASIDAIQTGQVAAVADAQDDFVRKHGFVAWSRVMAPLATGERLLYRAWSAASDGHRTEAVASIAQALAYVEEADEALRGVAR